MDVGPGLDSRSTIRRWSGVSETWIARSARVTLGAVRRFEAGKENAATEDRLADVYVALLWIANGCCWPAVLNDEILQRAMARIRA